MRFFGKAVGFMLTILAVVFLLGVLDRMLAQQGLPSGTVFKSIKSMGNALGTWFKANAPALLNAK